MDNQLLPNGVTSNHASNVNGLDMHYLEAGHDNEAVLLLLHGFPELSYSWRDVMPSLAQAGFRVIAPDQRGYGETTGWTDRYDDGFDDCRMTNLVRDAMGLLHVLGVPQVKSVIGHDFGSPVAAWCALMRPDIFTSVVMMSAPFAGPPGIADGVERSSEVDVHAELAKLRRPRKHYQWYYSTREANEHMWHAPQGLKSLMHAYFHVKSADWSGNQPYALQAWRADQLALMPTYYIMDLNATMAETVEAYLPSDEAAWLSEKTLEVYCANYARTGFQGGLNWYRAATSPKFLSEYQVYSGRTIDVPSAYIAGASDWGIYQRPGDFQRMSARACTDMRCVALIDGAGHWVQQEQPGRVTRTLLEFLTSLD